MHLALAEIPSFSHDHFRVRLKLRSAVYSGWRQECAATFDIMVVTKMFNAHVLFGSVSPHGEWARQGRIAGQNAGP